MIARNILQLESDASILPIGVGYLGWKLELANSAAVTLLSLALKRRVQAVWFAFGDDLGQWVKFVRDYDKGIWGYSKTQIFVQISNAEEARKAIYEWKADVIVAQGGFSMALIHTTRCLIDLLFQVSKRGDMGIAPLHLFYPCYLQSCHYLLYVKDLRYSLREAWHTGATSQLYWPWVHRVEF